MTRAGSSRSACTRGLDYGPSSAMRRRAIPASFRWPAAARPSRSACGHRATAAAIRCARGAAPPGCCRHFCTTGTARRPRRGTGWRRSCRLCRAGERAGLVMSRRTARAGSARGDADALPLAHPLARREVQQVAPADRYHLGRPGPSRLDSGGQHRHRVVQAAIAPAHRVPRRQVGRLGHPRVRLEPLCVDGAGEEAWVVLGGGRGGSSAFSSYLPIA